MNFFLNTPERISELIAQLESAALLLVIVDFDGTIADIADYPDQASLEAGVGHALEVLAQTANTSVVILSGRDREDLRLRVGNLAGVRLIGGHGGQFDGHVDKSSEAGDPGAIDKFVEQLQALTERFSGLLIERKIHGLAVHYRNCDETYHEIIRAQVAGLFSTAPFGMVRSGKCVVEFSSLESDKGYAIKRLCSEIQPSAVVFIGDDETDEDGFRALPPEGVSIKVGAGDTAARYRMENAERARMFIRSLASQRRSVVARRFFPPIESLAFISDMRTGAVIDGRGSVVWMSVPAFDAPPLFGSLLGGGGAGYFRVELPGEIERSYGSGDLILESRSNGALLTDFLDGTGGRAYQRAGRTDLVRILSGSGTVSIDFAPRFNFGSVPTRLSVHDQGLRAEFGSQVVALRSPGVVWQILHEGQHDRALGRINLRNDPQSLELRIGTGSLEPALAPVEARLQNTRQFWSAWLRSLSIPPYKQDFVSRSALILRALTYGPSGAILAAATTSLPEVDGGVRNWDYRYCWIRDAALAAAALVRLGSTGTAMRLLDWLAGVLDETEPGSFLSPLYTLRGGAVPPEAEIQGVSGYRDSRPVRVGNLASTQLQLDVLGPMADLLAALANAGAALGQSHAALALRFLHLIREKWMLPDSGIWEMRSAPRHYVHSKVMCWAAVRSSRRVLSYLGEPAGEWESLEQKIRSDIETRGYFPSVGSYVAAYDNGAPDAALLWIVLAGFHDPLHERALGTVEYVKQHLLERGGVYRYHYEDALSGREGHFHLCTCWLIEALALQGKKDEARELFEGLQQQSGALGLLAEEHDPLEGRALGNFPQLYSHLGIINAACAIAGRQ